MVAYITFDIKFVSGKGSHMEIKQLFDNQMDCCSLIKGENVFSTRIPK